MTDVDLALNEFVEMVDDYLDPEGNTTAETVIDHYSRFRHALAMQAVDRLKAYVAEHPEFDVSSPPASTTPTEPTIDDDMELLENHAQGDQEAVEALARISQALTKHPPPSSPLPPDPPPSPAPERINRGFPPGPLPSKPPPLEGDR